jgi:hypothetical protein
MTPRTAVLILAALPLSACASAPPARAGSPLELRQAQSRSYAETDTRNVLKSVLATLQDEGFTVRTADSTLGFITATRENLLNKGASPAVQAARWTAAVFTYGAALLIPVPKYRMSQVEGTAHVEDLGGGDVRLRLSFQYRMLDKNGRVQELVDVTDPTVYQAFLAKVDKSLYYQREKL